jgi:hypothetical protein
VADELEKGLNLKKGKKRALRRLADPEAYRRGKDDAREVDLQAKRIKQR